MLAKRRITTALASIALAAGGILAVGASPAAAYTCQHWQDDNTYGATCSGISNQFRVHATCNDGASKYSPWKSSGEWTYAYCSGHRGIRTATVQFT
jgi:hypothetical protein